MLQRFLDAASLGHPWSNMFHMFFKAIIPYDKQESYIFQKQLLISKEEKRSYALKGGQRIPKKPSPNSLGLDEPHKGLVTTGYLVWWDGIEFWHQVDRSSSLHPRNAEMFQLIEIHQCDRSSKNTHRSQYDATHSRVFILFQLTLPTPNTLPSHRRDRSP